MALGLTSRGRGSPWTSSRPGWHSAVCTASRAGPHECPVSTGHAPQYDRTPPLRHRRCHGCGTAGRGGLVHGHSEHQARGDGCLAEATAFTRGTRPSPDDLAERTEGTADQSTCMWPSQLGSPTATSLLAWQFRDSEECSRRPWRQLLGSLGRSLRNPRVSSSCFLSAQVQGKQKQIPPLDGSRSRGRSTFTQQ